MFRLFAFTATLALLGACTNSDDLDKGPVNLGNFALGHNIVVAPHPVKGPLSRDASAEEWIASVKSAIAARFDRYDGSKEGDKLYHLGISVDGYVLAEPGIPVVLSPKSVLILNLTVWDDAAGKKLNETPEQIVVLESLSGETVVGSGLTQSAEQQMENLSRNAAKLVQNYLVKQYKHAKWFREAAPAEKPATVAAKTPPETEEASAVFAPVEEPDVALVPPAE